MLGRTGVEVTPLCLGAMMFGAWGNTDHAECTPHYPRRAWTLGSISSIPPTSIPPGSRKKSWARSWPSSDRTAATRSCSPRKFHARMGEGPNREGNSRRWIISECEASLRRLGTDYIDLYQIHRPSPGTDIDDTLSALSDLVHAGKIRYFGSSTFPAWAVVEAHWVSERRGRERLSTEQPPYSMLARGIETDLLHVCQQYGMGVLSWSPLAGGWLSGRFGTGKDNSSRRAARMPAALRPERPGNATKLAAVDQLTELAAKAGYSLPELAVAFVLEHPAVTSAIIGPRTMEQLTSLLKSYEIRLDGAILDRIDEIVPPGTDLNTADSGWAPPWLSEPALRRQ